MVVTREELEPYADIQLVLMQALEQRTGAWADMLPPEDGVEGYEIVRVPGRPDDGLTDYPHVRVSAYANDQVAAQRLAERARQIVQSLDNGGVIEMAPDCPDPELAGKTVQFDTARGDVPPEGQAYPNPNRTQVTGFFAFSLRRPR